MYREVLRVHSLKRAREPMQASCAGKIVTSFYILTLLFPVAAGTKGRKFFIPAVFFLRFLFAVITCFVDAATVFTGSFHSRPPFYRNTALSRRYFCLRGFVMSVHLGFGCRGRTRTADLEGMNLVSCRCSTLP